MRREILACLTLYAASYALFYVVLGPGFISYKLLSHPHFLNPEWLRQDFSGSLLHLHGQPPLMNFLIGIIFKTFPDHYETLFRLLYFALGASAAIALLKSLRLMGISRRVRVGIIAMLCLTPTFYMFGTWYASTHIEFCLSAWLLYFFARYFLEERGQAKSLTGIFFCFALLGLTRPQWHLGIVILAALLLMYHWRGRRAQFALLSLIFLVPLGGWYAKNEVQFGFFGSSSWLGLNIGQVAAQIPANDLAKLKEQGKISADFPTDFYVERMAAPQQAPEHPALGLYKSEDAGFRDYAREHDAESIIYNLNYAGIIPAAHQELKDSLVIIREYPLQYAQIVLKSVLGQSLRPSFYTTALNIVGPGRWRTSSDAVALVAIAGSFALYLLIPCITLWEQFGAHHRQLRPLLWVCLLLMAYLVLSASALNGYEQQRMRWCWQPLYIAFAALFLERIMGRKKD